MRGRNRLSAVLVLALATACGAGAAAPPRVVPPPARIHVGDTWNAIVRASKPKALVIASGRERRSFRLVRRGAAYRAHVRFPHAGRWRYGVLSAQTTFVGVVDVRPPRLGMVEPFDIVEERVGSFLVADRAADAVYRLRDRELTLVATLPTPRDLEPTPDGHVLVASANRVVSLDPSNGRLTTVVSAKKVVLGVARLPDGAIVVSEDGSRLLKFDGGQEDVLASGLDGVHGLLSTDRGLVMCESSTGRVLRLGTGGGVDVVATGLALPSFAAPAPAGALYVAEFGAGRIARIGGSGGVTAVANVPGPAAISLTSDGRILAASLTRRRVVRIDPATGRLTWLL